MEGEPRLPRAEVHASLRVPEPDLREEPGEERAMERVLVRLGARQDGRRGLRSVEPELADDVLQLAVDLGPFAHAQPR